MINKYSEPLTSLMDNVLARQLGEIAREAGSAKRNDVGDYIDRGLILRRLLQKQGFYLVMKETSSDSR